MNFVLLCNTKEDILKMYFLYIELKTDRFGTFRLKKLNCPLIGECMNLTMGLYRRAAV